MYIQVLKVDLKDIKFTDHADATSFKDNFSVWCIGVYLLHLLWSKT